MQVDVQKLIEEAEAALAKATTDAVFPLEESEGEADDADEPEALDAKPPFWKQVLHTVFGKSSAGDVISSVAGYITAGAVGLITTYAPTITGETTVTQLVGAVVALGVATLGRLIESNR
jgi:hypothetical protein